MEIDFKWLYTLLKEQGLGTHTAGYLNLAFNVLAILLLTVVLDFFLRKIIVQTFAVFSKKTSTRFDDFLVASNFPKYAAHIIPFLLIRWAIPFVLEDFPKLETILEKATDVYLIVLVIWIIRSFVNTTRNYLKTKENFKDKPLRSYSQVTMILIWFIGGIYIFKELTGLSITQFLTTLGAASAILLLIFKDTILGFVASIQISINDIVRIGDWITQEKYGADGDVVEINLTTVTVQNFDNTFTTIPTYSFISDSFKNWRGMQESGGRRIKRAIYIKANSVKFLSADDLKKLSSIQMVAQYIQHRQKEIDAYNEKHGYNKAVLVNGRNQTNLGVFRKYCDLYLKNHPAVNEDLMMMTRHLAPTTQGIPLEIYLFSSDKRWENYERIMADIFEHLIAALPYFDLELFELPAGKDVEKLYKN